MAELNPEHPVTRGVHNVWHKIAALLMVKFGVEEVVITEEDIKGLTHGAAIVLQDTPTGLIIRMTDMEEARQLLLLERAQPGGKPS